MSQMLTVKGGENLKKSLSLDYTIRFEDIAELNPNFAAAKMFVAYTGENRNGSYISREVFEDAIPTMFNCPVVGRYIRDENCFGSHDIEIIVDKNEVKIVNATTPFGVIPQGAEWHFENKAEADGTIHEYLVVDVILWKRQEGYDHIAEVGSIDESMECNFDEWHYDSKGIMVADKLCFSAFCLLESAKPCFEQAAVALENFESGETFREQFSLMLNDFKKMAMEQSIKFNFDIDPDKKGGVEHLFDDEIRDSILTEFGYTVEDLDFEILEDETEETFRAKMEDFKKRKCEKKDPDPEDDPDDDPDDPDDDPENKKGECKKKKCSLAEFAATYGQKRDALTNALAPQMKGEVEVYYWICDFDDTFAYVERNIWVKNDCNTDKGRFRYSFDDETKTAEITSDFEVMIVRWLTIDEDAKLEQSRETFEELVKFRDEHLKAEHDAEINNVIAEFEDIGKVAEFAELKEKAFDYKSVDELREKCFAIRGKQVKVTPKKKDDHIRIPIEPTEHSEGRYGDLFERFAFKNN